MDCQTIVALFPCPAQLSITCSTEKQDWAGPGNEARQSYKRMKQGLGSGGRGEGGARVDLAVMNICESYLWYFNDELSSTSSTVAVTGLDCLMVAHVIVLQVTPAVQQGYSDTLYDDILWCTVIYCDVLWYTVMYCGIL